MVEENNKLEIEKKEKVAFINTKEYSTIFLIALFWCTATHFSLKSANIIFNYFKIKSKQILIPKLILYVLYLSFILYLFQSIVLPFINSYILTYFNINLEEQWLVWAVTLGITLGMSLFQNE